MIQLHTDDVNKYVTLGIKDKNWYQECELVLEQIFGDKRFLAAEMLAATSMNTSMTSNVTLFRKAWYQYHEGLEFKGFMPNIQKQLQQIRNGTGITGPKITAFKNAMCGDINAVVVDVWISRIFKVNTRYVRNKGKADEMMRESGISKKVFEAVESYVRAECVNYSLTPREMGASLWSGIRRESFPNEKTHYRGYLIKHFSTLF